MIINVNTGPAMPIALDTERLPILFVCSHERSGTHFLMNTVAANTKYSVQPYINFDYVPLGNLVNFYSSQSVLDFVTSLDQLKSREERSYVSSIIKSHHPVDTFEKCLDNERVALLYIHRNPLAVLNSFWGFLHRWEWREGPKVASFRDFVLSPPEGQLMRYQHSSFNTMIARWASHTSEWIKASETHENVIAVSFESLRSSPETCLRAITNKLGVPMLPTFTEPSREDYIKGANISATAEQLLEVKDVIRAELSKYPEAMKLLDR